MKPSAEMLTAMETVKTREFATMRDYCQSLFELMRASNHEVLELTSHDGEPNTQMALQMCYDFVVSQYFKGKRPSKRDVNRQDRYAIEKAKFALYNNILGRLGVDAHSHLYADELEQFRGLMKDRAANRDIIESTVDSDIRKLLRSKRGLSD